MTTLSDDSTMELPELPFADLGYNFMPLSTDNNNLKQPSASLQQIIEQLPILSSRLDEFKQSKLNEYKQALQQLKKTQNAYEDSVMFAEKLNQDFTETIQVLVRKEQVLRSAEFASNATILSTTPRINTPSPPPIHRTQQDHDYDYDEQQDRDMNLEQKRPHKSRKRRLTFASNTTTQKNKKGKIKRRHSSKQNKASSSLVNQETAEQEDEEIFDESD
jgi:cell wall-associated NlpC family hydrolase